MEQNQIKNEEIVKTVSTNPELREKLEKSMSPEERLDINIEKEGVEEKETKVKTLRERIFGMLKPKTVAEITNPSDLRTMAREDSIQLGKIATSSIELGARMSASLGYRDLMKKYNMDNEEGERMVKELELLKKELNEMKKGPEKVEKRIEFNKKHFQFTRNLHNIVEKRIQELS